MRCPFCSTEETKVIDSRLVSDGYQVRRRRECGNCHERFTTFETAELVRMMWKKPSAILLFNYERRVSAKCQAIL